MLGSLSARWRTIPPFSQAKISFTFACVCLSSGVDNDVQQYAVGLLREWKRLSEEAARLEIEQNLPSDRRPRIDDVSLIRFYAQCFDRPAFQDPFRQEGSMEAFDEAMEDTLMAINTGSLRSRRDGVVLSQSWGKPRPS